MSLHPKNTFLAAFRDQLVRWFVSPVFAENEIKTHRAEYLNIVLIIVLVLMSFFIAADLFKQAPYLILVSEFIFWVSCLISKHFLNQGHIKKASLTFLILAFVTLTMRLTQLRTILSPLAFIYMTLIFIASVLYNRRGFVVTTLLCSLALLGLTWYINTRSTVQPNYFTILSEWFILTLIFFCAGLLNFWSFQALQQALAQAEVEITERQQAEKALHDSEMRYKAQFKNLPVPTYTWQRKGDHFILIDFNDAANTYTNGNIANLLGKSHYELYAGQPNVLEDSENCFTHQTTIRREQQLTFRSTGQNRDVDMTYVFVPPDMIVVHADDITERKRAETERQENEMLYRTLFEKSRDAISFIDLNTRTFVEVNPSFCEMNGFRREELLGQQMNIVQSEETTKLVATPEIIDAMIERLRRDGVLRIESANRTHDGREIPIESMMSILTFQGREVIFAIDRDMTESKQTQAALQRSKHILEEAQVIAKLGSWTADLKTSTFNITPEAARILDWTPGLHPMDKLLEISHPDDRETIRAAWQAALGGEPYDFEHRLIINGENRWFHTTANITFDSHGQATSAFGVIQDINEWKQAEEAQRESERLYRNLFENTMDAINLIDVATMTIVDCNQSSCKRHGFRREELLGKPLNYLHGEETATMLDNPKLLNAQLLKLRRDGVLRDIAYHRTRDGRELIIDTCMSMIHLRGREILVGIDRDITEQKQAEAQLAESEARYRTLFEEMPLGVLLANTQGTIVDANQAFIEILGSPSVEMTKQINLLTFPPLVAAGISGDLQHAINSKEIYRVERQYTSRWGKTVNLQITFVPTGLVKNQEEQFYALVDDITESKEAEQALRTSEAKYRGLMESIDNVVATVDANGTLLYMNEHGNRQFGKTQPEMVGKPLHQLFSTQEADRMLANVQKVIRDHQRFALEDQSRVNGELRWFRIVFQPILDSSGQIIYTLVNATDIHELKTTQQELEALNQTLEERVKQRTIELVDAQERLEAANLLLEKALRSKDEFMAAMSHELRSPLNSILGPAEVLLLNPLGNLTSKQLRSLETIQKNGERLFRMIKDVLDYSILQANDLRLQLSPCDLSSLCAANLQTARELAPEKHQQLDFQMTPEILHVHADEPRLKQALDKLLDNAVKFTPQHGQIKMRVTGSNEEHLVRISIIDSGIGIQADDFPKLFKPFVQLDARLARAYEGAGLGLALVKALVELHKGTVEVESVLGQGSCFTVTLPWNGQ